MMMMIIIRIVCVMYKEEEIISVTPEIIQELLPTRLVCSKKGDNGIVLVVGGSTVA